jgi:hypothetical protein
MKEHSSMSDEQHKVVRPAGAPMVSVDPPPWAQRADAGAGAGLTAAATEQVRDAGNKILEDSKERARVEVDQRSTWAGEKVEGIAADVRDIAGDLRARGKDQPARIAEDAAERIERFGAYLRDADTDRIIADARGLGRRQPAAIVAGAAVIGIMAGRLVKASGPSDQGKGPRNG